MHNKSVFSALALAALLGANLALPGTASAHAAHHAKRVKVVHTVHHHRDHHTVRTHRHRVQHHHFRHKRPVHRGHRHGGIRLHIDHRIRW